MKRIARTAVAAICGFLQQVPHSGAAEYAFSAYPLGSLSFDAGVTPPQGVYVSSGSVFYQGRISGPIDFGGRIFDAGAKVDIFASSVSGLYVPQTKVLGGNFGFSVSVPAGHIDIDASASGPQRTVESDTEGAGLGDVAYQAQLGWDHGDFSHTVRLLFVSPTGRWERGFNPIIGLNRPSLDASWAFSWTEKNSKLQFNAAIGFMFNLDNNVTQYQTGDEFHLEWAIGRKFDNGLEIGVVGYDYRQLTGDSGQGALLGPFEGVVDAIGVGVTYSTKIGETFLTFSARQYEEYNTERRFNGNLSIATVTARF